MPDPIYLLAPRNGKAATPPGPEFSGASVISEFVTVLRGSFPERDFLVQKIMDATRDKDHRVHAETLLVRTGALAGAAALYHASVMDMSPFKTTEDMTRILSSAEGEEKFRKSIKLISLLAGDRGHLSVSRIVNGGALFAGATTICDPNKVLPRVEASLGTARFGIPEVVPQHAPHELPRVAVARLWPQTKAFLQSAQRDPSRWMLDLAAAAQIFQLRAKAVLAPDIAANLVLQSAVAMSFLDPTDIDLPQAHTSRTAR